MPSQSAPVILSLSGVTKRFGALVANRRDRPRSAPGRDPRAPRRERRRQDDADEHPLRPLCGRRGLDPRRRARTAALRALPPGSPHAALEAGIGMVHQHFALAESLTVLENIVLGTRSLAVPRLGLREARARLLALMRETGLVVRPDAAGLAPRGRRAAEGRDPQGPVPRRAHPRARRADGRADAAGGRRPVRRAAQASRFGPRRRVHLAQAARGPGARRPRRGSARRAQGRRPAGRRNRPGDPRRPHGRPRGPGEPARAAAGGCAVLRLERVSTPAVAGQAPLRDASLEAREGEIVGIAGVSGNGQAALAALLAGTARARGGRGRCSARRCRARPGARSGPGSRASRKTATTRASSGPSPSRRTWTSRLSATHASSAGASCACPRSAGGRGPPSRPSTSAVRAAIRRFGFSPAATSRR